MSEKTWYIPGTFCWPELGTSDAMAAKRFYGGLFGWEAHDQTLAPGVVYTLFKLRGKDVGGCYGLSPEMAAQGIPTQWMSYIAVSSADESAKAAEKLGGKVRQSPFDVHDLGRMAVLEDPTGAAFSLWEAKKHIGAQLRDETGTLVWNELLTRDASAAERFYAALFGWTTERMPTGPAGYTMFKSGKDGVGGMFPITQEMGGIHPNWMVYYSVADCDQAVASAKCLGGTVMMPPKDIPEVGRIAALTDPQGATFSVIKPNPASK